MAALEIPVSESTTGDGGIRGSPHD